MASLPPLPKNAPFNAEDLAFLNQLVQRSTPLQRSWLSGFLAGLDAAQGAGSVNPQVVQATRPRIPLTILYGSESGNAEALAFKAKKIATKLNCDPKVLDMSDATPESLVKSQNLLVFISTWGEGDPPQRATDFYKALMEDTAPKLEGLRFAVLSLGDTAYVNFCETGKKIDARLEALGATRITDRIDLDLDYAKAAAQWTEKTIEMFVPPETSSTGTIVHVDFKGAGGEDEDAEPLYTADNPCDAEVSALLNLNGTGSTRETWHVELSVAADGFTYDPGSAIGIFPENDSTLAFDVARAVGLEGDSQFINRLIRNYDITTLSRSIVASYAKVTGRKDVSSLLEGEAFAQFSSDRQFVDFLEAYPEKLSQDQLISLLRPLPSRLYSVASSMKAHPSEAHLLIGAVRWTSHGRKRGGVASTFFADRRKVGDHVRVYVKPNRHFALPKDGNTPIIMIGAGTGIAPYRSFVEERVETNAKGKSWLIFGERNYTNDFLYQLEWQDHISSGFLTRIDVAFSRDQPEKIYVQNRLWEARDEILKWLDEGAQIYICGDEKRMAKDVETTLVRILAERQKGVEEEGRAKLKELTKAGRYQRDVY